MTETPNECMSRRLISDSHRLIGNHHILNILNI
nr:MAG TPA: hypothetical protein [Caudoviricetes sp.]